MKNQCITTKINQLSTEISGYVGYIISDEILRLHQNIYQTIP